MDLKETKRDWSKEMVFLRVETFLGKCGTVFFLLRHSSRELDRRTDRGAGLMFLSDFELAVRLLATRRGYTCLSTYLWKLLRSSRIAGVEEAGNESWKMPSACFNCKDSRNCLVIE